MRTEGCDLLRWPPRPHPSVPRCPSSLRGPPHLTQRPAAVLPPVAGLLLVPFVADGNDAPNSHAFSSPAVDELFPNQRNGSRPWDPAGERPPAASPCRTRGAGQAWTSCSLAMRGARTSCSSASIPCTQPPSTTAAQPPRRRAPPARCLGANGNNE